jgi:hypothetical protein
MRAMRGRSRLLPILTILALALATLGSGVSHGQAAASERVVICTGHGVTTILVDAEGTPVERRVLCPDCALTAVAAACVPRAGAPEPAPRAVPRPRPVPAAMLRRPVGLAEARAPPHPG